MSTLILRQGLGNTESRSANVSVKNYPLTDQEVDNNFNNLNNSVELSQGAIGILNYSTTSSYTQANLAFDQANVAISIASSGYNNSNSAFAKANAANTIASSAYNNANSAFDKANSANTIASSAFDQANIVYNLANTKYSSSGGVISGNVAITGTLIVDGNVYFSGNVTSVSANNLSIKDNMIYLNEGANNGISDPDLGFVGAYNDGIYRHAGFFRDASDGIFKVFDNYEPEPDASIYIDTSNNTFRIANFQANTIYANSLQVVGNSTLQGSLVATTLYQGGQEVLQVAISGFNNSNSAYNRANSAFDQANLGILIASSAYNNSNSAFNKANSANTIASSSYNNSNSAYNQANIAFSIAISGYDNSNSASSIASSSYNNSNSAFAKANAANTIASSAYNNANSAFDKANSANTIASSAYNNANSAFDKANVSTNIASSAYNNSNSAFDKANSAYNLALSGVGLSEAYNQANLAFFQANSAFDKANAAYDLALSGSGLSEIYNQANLAFFQANSAFDKANSANTIASSAYNNSNSAYDQANTAYDLANTKFSSSGGTVSGNVYITGTMHVDGNVTFSGNVTTISANNLSVQDNMIYLNSGSNVANPDLGFVGNYNDGIYHHAGFFRDASDGIWKVFDNYEPEPDASPYIDTSNSTFRIAGFEASTVYANNFVSSIATGTSPFSVVSTTLVSNLNVDYLDGHHGSYYTDLSNSSYVFASSIANSAYNNSNSAFAKANSANTIASSAFDKANSANTIASSAYNNSNSAYNNANSAFAKANSANTIASSAYDNSNSAYNNANSAFAKANAANTIASSAYNNSNSAFGQANLAVLTASSAYNNSNSAYNNANSAYNNANSAFDKANSANTIASSAYNNANSAFAKANAANTIASSAYNNANSAFDKANSANTIASSSYNNANAAFTTANSAYNNANSAFEKANSANTIASSAYNNANAAFNTANSAYNHANSSYNQANSAIAISTSSYIHANSSYAKANAANTIASSAYDNSNSAYNQANSSLSAAQSAYNQANSAYAAANAASSSGIATAYNQANAAYLQANTKVYNFYQSTAPTSANSRDFWTNSDTGVVYENFGTTSSPIWAEFGPTGLIGNNSPGVISATNLNVTYTPPTSTGSAINVSAANSKGGIGYSDVLAITNISGGATNPNKTIRLNSTGGIEIIDSTYSNILLSLTDGGNLSTKGTIVPGAYVAGQVIKDIILSNSEVTVVSTTIAGSGTNSNFVTYNYTPSSSSSYLIIHYHLSKYQPQGTTDDSWYSVLLVDGNEIAYGWQMVNDNGTGTSGRSGVLFPLTGRYTNSSTTSKQIQVAARRDTADDSIIIDNSSTSMWLRITEIAR
jgi:cytoskeletal protein CcmA (bactofilin family)